MNGSINHEETLFEQALRLRTPAEQESYVRESCANDAPMCDRLLGLLAAHDRAGMFLEHQQLDPSSKDPRSQAETGVRSILIQVPPTEGLATVIGRYKLLQKIGEGGMGVVYMAEQAEPVRRRVALKIIKLGMDTKSVIARFEAERQALAMMDHPNIAKVLDGGATEDGRPYFVMELVRGIKITEYCDEAKLLTRGRLDLFIKVCQAIQHAHQKGIIHRDIKPSNILVTINDGIAVPKVIDFGIAKATEGRLTDKTFFTQFEAFIGTPAYVSPEQAVMTGLDIDTRSDIYSLGVLLYELLAGSTPFDAKELMASGIDAMRKTIREQEPIRPSTKLRQTLVAADVRRFTSSQSQIENQKSQIDPDLDWIVMKCLEKDRARRYETTNGLASDLQRHLNNEAVLARPPSAVYRFQKLIRRNKLAFASATTVTTALILGLAVSSWQMVAARDARNAEKQQRLAAQSAQRIAESQRERADQNLYDSEMSLAQHAWDEGDHGRTLSLLEAHRPQTGEKDRRSFEWFYFRNLCEGDPHLTLRGHNQTVNCVALSPDGKLLATGSAGDAVRIWESATGQTIQTLPELNVDSLAFTPDGKMLGVGGRDQLAVWNLETRRIVFKQTNNFARFRIAFLPDGTRAAIGKRSGPFGKEGGSSELWDYATGELKHAFPESGGYVAVSQRGECLATASSEKSVRIWNSVTGQLLSSIKTGETEAIALSPDGRILVTSHWGPEVELWNVSTGQQIGSLTNNHYRVWSLAFSSDGKFLVTGGADQSVRIWDVATLQQIERLQGHGNEVVSVALSTDGQTLASGSKDKSAMLWTIPSDLHLRRTTTTVSSVGFHPVFSRDGRWVAAGDGQGNVAAWDVATLQSKISFADASDALSFSPDGSALLTRGPNYFLRKFDVATGSVRETIPGRPAGEADFHTVLSPDGRILVFGLPDGTLAFSDARTGVVKATTPHAFSEHLFQLAFSPNGKLLALASSQPEAEWTTPMIKIWDMESYKIVATLLGHTDVILSVDFSPNGKVLATCSADNTIKFWDTTSWKESLPSLGQKEYVTSLAFSADGKVLATVSNDRILKLWNSATRHELASFKLNDDAMHIVFSPDGQAMAVRSWNGSLRLWRAPRADKKEPLLNGG